MKKILLNLLLKLLFRKEFVELDDVDRLGVYLKLNAPDIIQVLKHRYTNSLIAHTLSTSDEERWIFKGRVLEILDFLNSIENAESSLLNIEKYKKRSESREKVVNPLKEKLIGLTKTLIIKPK